MQRKIYRQQKNRNVSISNSSAPSQNIKIKTSCRRIFEKSLPSTPPTEITFDIKLNVIVLTVLCLVGKSYSMSASLQLSHV